MSDLLAAGRGESRSVRLDKAIHALLSQTPEIEAAAVVSFDGLPMAAALPPSMDEDRVAAMSAALLSLGERAAQGLGRGELSQVYIEGDNGTVFLISADDEAVLVAVASQGAKVGMMLYEVRRAAAVVADVLREDEPVVPEQKAPAPTASVPGSPSASPPSAPLTPAPSAPEPVRQQVSPPAPLLTAVPTTPANEPSVMSSPPPVYTPAPDSPWSSSYAPSGSVLPAPGTSPTWS